MGHKCVCYEPSHMFLHIGTCIRCREWPGLNYFIHVLYKYVVPELCKPEVQNIISSFVAAFLKRNYKRHEDTLLDIRKGGCHLPILMHSILILQHVNFVKWLYSVSFQSFIWKMEKSVNIPWLFNFFFLTSMFAVYGYVQREAPKSSKTV